MKIKRSHIIKAAFECEYALSLYELDKTYIIAEKAIEIANKEFLLEAAREKMKTTYDQQKLDGTWSSFLWECRDTEEGTWSPENSAGFSWLAEFEYRFTPKPQIDWKNMPIGVMTDKGELRGVYDSTFGKGLSAVVEHIVKGCVGPQHSTYLCSDLKLADTSKQPWIFWCGNTVIIAYRVIGDKI